MLFSRVAHSGPHESFDPPRRPRAEDQKLFYCMPRNSSEFIFYTMVETGATVVQQEETLV